MRRWAYREDREPAKCQGEGVAVGGPFGPGRRVTCLATDEHFVLAWHVERDRRGRLRTRQALRTGLQHRRELRRAVESIPLIAQRYPFDKEVEEVVVVTLVSDNGIESRVLLFGERDELDSWVAALS